MRRARELAEQLSLQLLDRAGIRPDGRIDVYRLAHGLGAVVTELEIPQDGRLLPGTNGATILISSGLAKERARFTIAHELGHWALRHESLRTPLVVATEAAFESEETLCNQVAGALLLPRVWLESQFPWARYRRYHNLFNLRKIAAAAECSLGATMVRVREVFKWSHVLLSWTFDQNGWAYDGEAGVYPWEDVLMPSGVTGWTITQVAAGGPHITRTKLPMLVSGREVATEAEILATKTHAVAMLRAHSRPRKASAGTQSR